MLKYKYVVFCLILSLAFTTAIWQIAEAKLVDVFGKLCYSLCHRSFIELTTYDKDDMPMHYYPGVGTFYDPELIAREASRFYDTRIDPPRLKAFIKDSDWLLAHIDSLGRLPQPYDFPPAGLKQPWVSAPSQTAAMLAIAKRAGYERNAEVFLHARKLFTNLAENAAGKDSLWLSTQPGEEDLRGMLSSLIDLASYGKLVQDSLALQMFKSGVDALAKRLPGYEKQGYLDDKYCKIGQRAEHRMLTQLLSEVSYATPDSVFKPIVLRFQAKDRVFVIKQLLTKPKLGRISGFLFAWLACFLLAYAFLRAPK
jgi:hypothetical protein